MGESRLEPLSIGTADDELCFERLYREHFEAIYSYVLRRVPGVDTADQVANVFAVAWRRIADVPPPPQDKLWLFGVARRVVSQHTRATSRQERLSVKLGHSIAPVATGASPERSDLEEKVARLVDGLRPAERELVTLIAWDGLTHAEVASVLGCSTNAVGIRWHRALKRLRHRIGDADTTRSTALTALSHPLTEET